LLRELFEDAGEAVAGVVNDDIDALELVDCGFERGVDVGFLCDVEFQREIVLHFVSMTRGGIDLGNLPFRWCF
jgi:hypothetical protein